MKEAVDRIQVGGMKLPKLKGRTTIILHDVKTGEEKKIVSENMVTNAVAKIFANNYCNTLNPADKRLLPIKNLFGGVLCFGQTLTENASNIFPPNEGSNPLIAHAGSETDSQIANLNPKMGTLDTSNCGEITNGYKWQWFFNLSQGVGTISACCLTSALGGNVGLTPVGDTYANTFMPSLQNVYTGVNSGYPTVDNVIYTPMKFDRTTNRAIACFVSGSTFTEITLETHPLKFGINSAPVPHTEDEVTEQGVVKNRYAWREISKRTASLTFSAGNDHAIITDGTDYWVLERYQSSGSYYIRMNKITTGGTDLVVTSLSNISGTNISVLPFYDSNSSYTRRMTGRYGMIPVRTDGAHKWTYLPSSDYTTFYKVDLNNLSDITLCTTHVPTDYKVKCWCPAYWAGTICCGYNFIINNDVVYPTAIQEGVGSSVENYFNVPIAFSDTPAVIEFMKYSKTNDTTNLGYIKTGIFAPYLATINNLDAPVQKTLSQTMNIIYEIIEVQEV